MLQVNYEASGWVTHQVSDIWAKTSPDRGQAVWALWPMGGAWLCTHLWEHYTFTMDKLSSNFSLTFDALSQLGICMKISCKRKIVYRGIPFTTGFPLELLDWSIL